MGQHVGIIGKINIKEHGIKAFLKSAEAKPLIEAITQVILQQSDDCYILNYDKETSVLSFFIYYKYATQETLQGEDFKALLSLSSFFTRDTSGYLIGYKDIFNISDDDIIYTYQVDNQQWQFSEIALSKEQSYEVTIQHNEHFKLLSKGKFCKHYSKAHLMMPLLTLVKKHLKAAKHSNHLVTLADASPLNPLLIFGGYYYNGMCVYTTSAILDGIDLATFVQTKYGGADANHIVVDNCVYKTDPTQFKHLFADYYSIPGKVLYYSHIENMLIEIKGACPKSFKDHGLICEDDNAIYFKKQRIEKSLLSSYRIYPDSGNFTKIFMSPEVAYFNNSQIDLRLLDASSIKFVQYLARPTFPDIIEAIDNTGKMILMLDNITQNVSVSRDVNFINQMIASISDASKVDHLSQIDSPKFQNHYKQHKKHSEFFTAILKYFSTSEKRYQANGQLSELQKIIRCYETIKESTYCAPYLYPFVIKAYALLGDNQNSLITIKHAIISGYHEMPTIWKFPCLTTLHSDPTFQKLIHFDEHRIKVNGLYVASLPLIKWLNNLSDDELSAYRKEFFSRHYFPSLEEMRAYRSHSEFKKIHLDDEPIDWEIYIASVQHIISRLFKYGGFDTTAQYDIYAEHESIPIAVHLSDLQMKFTMLHVLGKMSGNLNLLPLFQRIKTLISMIDQQPETQRQASLSSLKSNIVHRILIGDTL
ncbi:hypothetical protein [Thorsellia anophelis]|uniref:Uncharacterized protein n=1 Tax=Thorsellia anophelis DSM 18579 TaxID=1123402 RepID=A0A1H9YDA1_9GAMM|nr:hypothetical protein [Thorsellia anophelis]SES66529.1 hypothetical protein SAMN02583745_00177 [Thorsellia anophelis DSM 18579]